MAHDFNNLLTIIIGNLDRLDEELKNDDEKKRLSQAALEAAMRGADLTRRLLAFAS
jgi:signal transduction histidine kinase